MAAFRLSHVAKADLVQMQHFGVKEKFGIAQTDKSSKAIGLPAFLLFLHDRKTEDA